MSWSRKACTHGLAVAAGLAVAWTASGWSRQPEASRKTAESVASAPVRPTARPTVIRPRDLLRAMANVPMETFERRTLKSGIYEDWWKQDPLGFLAYFEHRRWPDNMYGEGPFEVLAQTQPEELLAYARRTGCQEAVKTLVEKGEIYRVLEVLGGDGLGRLPGHLLEDFVERGEKADPQFHEKLALITDAETLARAQRQVADTMKDAGRLEDLFSLISRYPEAFDDQEIGSQVALLLAQNPPEMERLDSISDSLRAETAKEMLSTLSEKEIGEEDQREILSGLASRGLLKGSGKKAFEVIMDQAEDSEPETRDAWKSWAMSLPQDESTRPVRLASMVMWAFDKPDQLDTLPAGELRDAATLGAIAWNLEKEHPEEAEALLGKLGNTGLRDKMLQYMEQAAKGEEPDEFDPFELDR